MKLYIIGNGFDLHHKDGKGNRIKSSYGDFLVFLKSICQNHPDISPFLDFCEELFPDSLWSDFERSLGEFDKDKYIERYNRLCLKFKNNQIMLNAIENELVRFQQDLDYYFEEWITSLETYIENIHITNPPNKKVNTDDLFLTFNVERYAILLMQNHKQASGISNTI